MKWTEEQARAITEKGSSILLSAAAGSGKTTVLVERILRSIEEGADIGRMLVVTFTRAAASDMRLKLARRLHERARNDRHFQDQELRLERAHISTLHSFCTEFLRTHFEACGVDPTFGILDETVSDRLRQEALDETLEEAYADPQPDLLALDYGRGPKGVRALLIELMYAMEARTDPEEWLRMGVDEQGEAIRSCEGELVASGHRSIQEAICFEREALLLPECPEHYRDAMEKDLEALEELLAIDAYEALWDKMSDFKQARPKGKRDAAPDERVKSLRDSAKDALKKARLLMHPLAQATGDLRAQAPQRKCLAALSLRAEEIYRRKKQELSALTFDDLERLTLEALKDDALAEEMRGRFDAVFVDEYQDTSDIQEAILSRLARRDDLFMVGDVKQSIYRFRQAEPELFTEKYARFQAGEGGRLLCLSRNFRSTQNILAFVNAVFEKVMIGGDTEIQYDALARLVPAQDAKSGAPVEIHLLESAARDDNIEEEIKELKRAEVQGLFIAKRIRELREEDASLRYRDIAILTRAKSSVFTPMASMLLSGGIPAFAEGMTGYFSSVEIVLALSMLRLVANGRSDVQLLGVLHSPIVSLSAEQLARIRLHAPYLSFTDAAYSAVKGGGEDGDFPLEMEALERLGSFLDRLEIWRSLNGQIDLGELTARVVNESGLYTWVAALPGGAQRCANIERLIQMASSFERDISGSLTRFLQNTDLLSERDDASANPLGENDDVVRLMTIHKSKGLEFRVVFGAMLERNYAQGARGQLLCHRDLGFAFSHFDPGLRSKRTTAMQSAIAERLKRQDAAEEMRILYVLLTRAMERLILTASLKKNAGVEARWKALSASPISARRHIDLIMSSDCAAMPCTRAFWHAPEETQVPAPKAIDLRAVMEAPEGTSQDDLSEALFREMTWQYPDSVSSHKPLKLTVTGLLREVQGPEVIDELSARPAFLMGDDRGGATGLERGTAYHRALQLLELPAFRKLPPNAYEGEIVKQLEECVEKRLMTQVQRASVEPAHIAAFLQGKVGQRMLAASTIHREWPFNVILKAREALTEEEASRFGDETLMVQGTIDCCFLENDSWVLLDYKTDRTSDQERIEEHYQRQLNFYCLALEKLTGKRVKERLLCMLSLGEVIAV